MIMFLRDKFIIFLILIGLFFVPVFLVLSGVEGFIFAQEDTTLLTQNESVEQKEQEKAELQRQLEEIEAQIAQYKQELSGIQGERNTLENKIKQLQRQQSTVNLQIKATSLQINELDNRLDDTEEAIVEGNLKIEQLRGQMAQIVRTINEYDSFPILYVIFSQNNLSDIFEEAERYLQISEDLEKLFKETTVTKNYLDEQMVVMAEQQEEARNLLSIKTLQKQQLTGSVNQQNNLLQETKGRENNYQAILTDTQKRAAEIRNRLYDLLGVKTQITFGEAVEIAQWVSGATGVRAAFLLAVLTQESNLGKNVGQCFIVDTTSGVTRRVSTGREYRQGIHPTRDLPLFLKITEELGLDSYNTPISCTYIKSGQEIGWGGAMGPAQFIPSTWMGYKSRIEAVTGKTANPWDIRDAFIAAGVKLGNDGATSQGGEWAAAMRYFSGSTNTRYRFYGDNVIALANQYQADIDSMSE